MGAGLVRMEKIKGDGEDSSEEPDYFVTPVTLLPNVIELSYYASALAPVFALESIVGKYVYSM